MHHAIADKLRTSKSGNHAENPFLLAPFQMSLEADNIVHRIFFIILTQLDNSIRFLPCPRIRKSYRFHRPETHRILTALRHHFHRHTPFKDISFFKPVDFRCLRRPERLIKCIVFLFVHGAVQVCRLSLIVAGHPVHDVHIKGFFHHDGRCGIIEVKSFTAAELFYAVRKSAVRQRPGRNNHDPFFRYFPDFFIHKCDPRMAFYLFRHCRRISVTIHRQSTACRDTVGIGTFHDHRPEPAHLFFQKSYRIGKSRRTERIAANQFRTISRMMGRRSDCRTHFRQLHGNPHFRQLPGSLASC